MKLSISLLLILALFLPTIHAREYDQRDIPIQNGGRIKPLDTYARSQLLSFYGKRSIKHDDISAIDWIFDLAIDPTEGERQRIFNIRNPEVAAALRLEWNSEHKYSFVEISPGIQDQLDLISSINQKPDGSLTVFESQLLEIYFNMVRFKEISHSLSCLIPSVPINDSLVAGKLGVAKGSKISYAYFVKHGYAVNELMLPLLDKPNTQWSSIEVELAHTLTMLNHVGTHNYAQSIKLLPPISNDSTGVWLSPWEVMNTMNVDPVHEEMLSILEIYLTARIAKDSIKMKSSLSDYFSILDSMEESAIGQEKLTLESWMNEANLFYFSVAFYLLALIFLGLSWMTQPKWLYLSSAVLLVIGWFYHAYGIYLRMVIMGRPPVSTLYETVLFVGLTVVTCSVILEFVRRDGLGIFIGTVVGSVLHYIGFGYAADGDTLEMLVAVLNSNFWLATHVTCVTLGYGLSLVAGSIGHLYLIHMIRNPKNKTLLKNINKNLFGMTLIALFFTLFGTILGGIWADQSWGRFWGWDPKENGALLIVLWQLMMIHMRLTAMVKPHGFALGMILNNIIVVIAWFGVNLLNIGLHSYGFAEGIAINLIIFISVELIIGFGTYFWAKSRQALSI